MQQEDVAVRRLFSQVLQPHPEEHRWLLSDVRRVPAVSAGGSMKVRTCGQSGGKTKAGMPCRCTLNLSPTNGLCKAHDPERAKEFAEMIRNARRKKPRVPAGLPAAPLTLADAVKWSSWAMHAVAAGEVDARTGHEIGYLVNAFKGAVEKRDMQAEIDVLKQQVRELQKRQPQRNLARVS